MGELLQGFWDRCVVIPRADRRVAVIAGESGACRHDKNRIAAKERKERRKGPRMDANKISRKDAKGREWKVEAVQ